MKIQYLYLKNFLKTKLTQKKIADVFTQVGIECEINGDLIEFDITPNRGDVLSLRGLEREFLANQSIKSNLELERKKLNSSENKKIIYQIDESGCGNYHLMLLKGLKKIKNLDLKKIKFLESAGIPLIHPLVDLGNYVMLEMGSPLHVFDLDKLSLPISVQFPKSKSNQVQVIGGDIKDVESSSLTIQDQSGIQAIAGIIGSESSSVSPNTKNIAVEAAFFRPEAIVNEARKYGLATDASHRFERGVDPQIQKFALERYLFLLSKIAEFELVQLYQSYSKVAKKKIVKLDIERFNKFSSLSLKSSEAIRILKNLDLTLIKRNSKILSFSIPSHRFDISIEEDLYEELLRCYGYDNVPISRPKSGPILKNKQDGVLKNLRLGFVHAGFTELMHMPFISKESFQRLNSGKWVAAELRNPINENEPLLRGSLFKSLFNSINLNVKKGYTSLKVFEVGNVFRKIDNSFAQEINFSGLIYHHEIQSNWSLKKFPYDFFELKGEIFKLFKTIGIENIDFKQSTSSIPFNENALDLFIGKQKIAVIGEIDLSLTEKLIRKPAFGFEIYPEKIKLHGKSLKIAKTSKFPKSSRDLNILIDRSFLYADVEATILSEKIKNLSSFKLINTFQGKDIPESSISLTLRFTFQSMKKSLQEEDINKSMQGILQLLKKRLNAKIRS